MAVLVKPDNIRSKEAPIHCGQECERVRFMIFAVAFGLRRCAFSLHSYEDSSNFLTI